MYRLVVALCMISLALSSPPTTRSREEIEAFTNYLVGLRNKENNVVAKSALVNETSEWHTSGQFEGDILLDDFLVDQLASSFAAGRNAYIWPNTKWPNDVVVWEYGAGEFTNAQMLAIEAGIREIELRTCIRFRRRTTESVYVRLTGNSDGCYAHVGYWQSRGVHTYNLARNTPGWGCFRHTTIIHEWLHIIGFLHMQSTYDRDNYVQIMWQNIQQGTEFNFDRYTQSLVNNLGLPYEYISTMHYPATGFSINGQPTIVALQPFAGVMGQTDYVTDLDYLRVNRHYYCPGAWN